MKNTAFHSRHLLTGLCCASLLAPVLTTQAAMQTAGGGHPAASAAQPHVTLVDAPRESAFLRVILPKQRLVVGELVPVKVKAYFRAGVSASLNGLPLLSSDAFTLNKLGDHPDQTREAINGVPYTVVTWSSALSAVKAGDYPLNIELPVMVRVQEKGQRRGGGRNPFKDFFGDDSPFGDSFFDDFFGQATEKPLTLQNEGGSMHIDALPLPGRPASFSGAVGQFQVSSEVPVVNATAGDPLTLKMTVSGTGNFDRVTTAGLPASASWKTYKPSAQFDAGDASATTGSKTFSQSIVPTHAGPQHVPAVAFSYFDPETMQYVTKQTVPVAIEVAPGAPAAAAPASAANAAVAPAPAKPAAPADGLAPDEPVTDHATSSLRPLVLAPWFLICNGLLAAALVLGGAWRWLQARRARDPERLQREAAEKAAHAALAELAAAQAAQDAPRFFNAGRHALQEQLATHWHLPAARVTLPEIQARLNGHGEEIRAVFQTADELAYSGRRFTVPDLRQWRSVIETQLQHIAHL